MNFNFFNTDVNNNNNKTSLFNTNNNTQNTQNNNINDIISLINTSILVNIHNHPLELCYTIERKNYGTGWNCNKCTKTFSYDIPSFYCTFCDFDLCHNCLGEYRLNEIKINDNNSNNYKLIQQISNGNFPWQKKNNNHSHLLTLIKRANINWICDICSQNFQKKDSSFYCSLCDFDICFNCLNQNNNIDNNTKPNIFDNNKSNLFDNKKPSIFDNNKSNLFDNTKPNIFDNNKSSLFDNTKPNIFDNNKSSLFDNTKPNIFDNNKSSLFYRNKQSLFDMNNIFGYDNFPKKNIWWENCHFCPKKITNDKPVIYLYPEKSMNVSVNLNIGEGKFTAVYPQFNEKNNMWKVHAEPNGEIIINNKKYPYLYYECESYYPQETNEGFIVDDKNAISFLEEKLKILGLNDKEMTDFITYWLPKLIKNKLSICTFQTQKFFNYFKLNITPKPDTLIRIFLSIKKIDSPIYVKEQKLITVERKGFTVVEWGGSNF